MSSASILNLEPGDHRLDIMLQRVQATPGSGHLVTLLMAVIARDISLTVIADQKQAWSPRCLPSERPRIVWLSAEDTEPQDIADWHCARSACAWARSAVLQAVQPHKLPYKLAVEFAIQTGRCLLVETDNARAPAWATALQSRGSLIFMDLPSDDEMHQASATSGQVL